MDITAIIVAILGSNFLVELFKALRDSVKNKDEVIKTDIFNPVKDAIFVMLQDRLEFLINKAIKQGSTTTIERKKLRGFLSAYEGMDGDDYIHDLWELYKDLPLNK